MRIFLLLVGLCLVVACGDSQHPEHMAGHRACTDPETGSTSLMSLNRDGLWVGESATRRVTWQMEGNILSQHIDGNPEPAVRMQIDPIDATHFRKRYFSMDGTPYASGQNCELSAPAPE